MTQKHQREAQALELRSAIRKLNRLQGDTPHPESLHEQPFDSLLLKQSALFRKSRSLFLAEGGQFEAALLSSPRSLSGSILLENRIQYSPTAGELSWTAHDAGENPARLLDLRTYTVSLFHEQNHRILWNFLPSPSTDSESQRRFLNFAESLVVVMDMALSDHLDSGTARALYLTGAVYDPGTKIRTQLRQASVYRNYLLVAMHATYLNLELFAPKDIEKVIRAIFGREAWVGRACSRALRLDRLFVQRTNPFWQHRNRAAISNFLQQRTAAHSIALEENPFEHAATSFWAQKWFELIGI